MGYQPGCFYLAVLNSRRTAGEAVFCQLLPSDAGPFNSGQFAGLNNASFKFWFWTAKSPGTPSLAQRASTCAGHFFPVPLRFFPPWNLFPPFPRNFFPGFF